MARGRRRSAQLTTTSRASCTLRCCRLNGGAGWTRGCTDPQPKTLTEAIYSDLQDETASPLVLRDESGVARGYVAARRWEIAADSPLTAFYAPRTGTAGSLVLPDPAESGGVALTGALLDALEDAWQRLDTTDQLIVWPSRDQRAAEPLIARGFRPEYVTALRQLAPLAPGRRRPPADLRIRPFRAEEEALVRLFREEMEYHTPFASLQRLVPALETDFRLKLRRSVAGTAPDAETPIVVVAAIAGVVAGWTESYLQTASTNTLITPGTSGYLRERRRHGGVARPRGGPASRGGDSASARRLRGRAVHPHVRSGQSDLLALLAGPGLRAADQPATSGVPARTRSRPSEAPKVRRRPAGPAAHSQYIE